MEEDLYHGLYRIPSARLKGYDYASPGAYFVTICADQHMPLLGEVRDGRMVASPMGLAALQCWQEIPRHRAQADIDAFCVMPNHVHGIIIILGSSDMTDIGRDDLCIAAMGRDVACNVSTPSPHSLPLVSSIASSEMSRISPRAGTLGAIVRSYKSAVTRWCRSNGQPEFGWQERYHDHIIRDERELYIIRTYIQHNAAKWADDRYYAAPMPNDADPPGQIGKGG